MYYNIQTQEDDAAAAFTSMKSEITKSPPRFAMIYFREYNALVNYETDGELVVNNEAAEEAYDELYK